MNALLTPCLQPAARAGPRCCAPSLSAFLALLCLQLLLAFPRWTAQGMEANLVFSCFCPISIWGPAPPSPWLFTSAFYLPSFPLLLGPWVADPHAACSLPVPVSPLSDPWDRLVLGFCLGRRASLCLSPPLPPLFPPSSQRPLWDMHFYLPLICSILFAQEK